MSTVEGIHTGYFNGRPFGPDVIPRIIAAIVGGAPFSDSLTRIGTSRASVAFPVLNDIDDPQWIAELGAIPSLATDDDSYEVATSKLAGTILLSQESVDDSSFPLETQLEQVLRDTFSNKLDRDMIGGTGPAPIPTGVLAVAPAVAGADLELAAIAAKADIATSGGKATHIALNAAALATQEAARDTLGRPLYPDATTTFAGLTTVIAGGATEPLVYDQSRLFLIVRNDFAVDMSNQTDEAWSHYAVSMRIIGRFALAVPMVAPAVRKLTVGTGATQATGASKSTAAKS